VEKKKFLSVSIILITIILFAYYFYTCGNGSKYLIQENPGESNAIEATRVGLTNKENNINLSTDYDLKSGPITILPWENEEEFLKVLNDNGNLTLLAAYHTVLKDPLPGEEYNVHLGAKMLKGKVINPGQVFSQNKMIGPYTEERGFKKGPTYLGTKLTTTIGGGVCKLASTLYNVSILSDLEIVERHAHGMPVPYVPHGQDATVAYGGKDIKFRNNTKGQILIWAQGIDNTLFMAFYGKEKPREVEWHHEMLSITKAPKVYKYSENIPEGTENIILEGMDGASVKSWITLQNTDGTVETRQLGISNYNPLAFIIEKRK
jgi:vancomycin resistance protein VanW